MRTTRIRSSRASTTTTTGASVNTLQSRYRRNTMVHGTGHETRRRQDVGGMPSAYYHAMLSPDIASIADRLRRPIPAGRGDMRTRQARPLCMPSCLNSFGSMLASSGGKPQLHRGTTVRMVGMRACRARGQLVGRPFHAATFLHSYSACGKKQHVTPPYLRLVTPRRVSCPTLRYDLRTVCNVTLSRACSISIAQMHFLECWPNF